MTAPLWTIDDMARAMGATRMGGLPRSISGISIDSRTVAPGEAFFAIRGDVHDGHRFVEAALKAGAALAVIDVAHRADFAAGGPLLVVPDVLAGLVALGRAARARTKARVIAVTGSVGKTSTKEALRVVLAAQGVTHASVASFNNHWGVPLTLARCPQDARFAVFEIGMNHAGEIEPLTKMVRPHIAIVTTIEPAHLEFFGSVEAIADAKAEIFAGLEPGGVAVLNRDNAQFAYLKQRAGDYGVARIVSFGADAAADIHLIECTLEASRSLVRASVLGAAIDYELGVAGRHMVMNSLAVLAAAQLAGADLAASAAALARLVPPSGRGARQELLVRGGSALLIDESYNANPASMRAAIAVLARMPVGAGGRRIAVFGDMLELGADGPSLHRDLAEALEEGRVDTVFLCGDLMRHLWDALPPSRRGGYAETSAGLESEVTRSLRAGDVVMVKGSLGSKMKTIVNALNERYAPAGASGKAAVS